MTNEAAPQHPAQPKPGQQKPGQQKPAPHKPAPTKPGQQKPGQAEQITRWRGFSHAELYAQLHAGPGAAAAAVPAQRWTDLASIFTTITQDLTKVVNDSETDWQGESAMLAFTQLSAVAAWADRVGENATGMRLSVEQQADHVGRARAAMPEPGSDPAPQAPDPAAIPAAQVAALQSDREPVERATSEAARKAYEVMQAYQNDTTSTTGSLTSFDEIVESKELRAIHHGSRRDTIAGLPVSSVPSTPGPGPATSTSTSDGITPGQHLARGSQDVDLRAEKVSTSSAEFVGMVAADEPDVRVRQVITVETPTPNGAGAAATAMLPSARGQSTRRTSNQSGAVRPVLAEAAPVAPVTPANATPGGTTDRPLVRRLGEPLVLSNVDGEAAVSSRRRREEREEPVKVTERVEGVDAEVPPSVIGSEPYRL